MRAFFPTSLAALVLLQIGACLFQLEAWPLTGHALYSRGLRIEFVRFHRYVLRFQDSREEAGEWAEVRADADDQWPLRTWCAKQRARPGFLELRSNRFQYKIVNGRWELTSPSEEHLCGS